MAGSASVSTESLRLPDAPVKGRFYRTSTASTSTGSSTGSSTSIDERTTAITSDTSNPNVSDNGLTNDDTHERRNSNTNPNSRAKLSRWSICAACYFNVSGGPWGSDELFNDGPWLGILNIALVAWIWSFPHIELTSEMCGIFPVNGGYSIWVANAFGPFWAFQESWWSWLSGVVDNSIYPVLIFDAFATFFPDSVGKMGYLSASACKMCLVFVLTLPNFISTAGTGRMLQVVAVLQLAPFIFFVLYGLTRMDWSVMLEHPDWSEVTFLSQSKFLLVAYWNLSGWDCVSTIAGEVENPAVNMRIALYWSLALTIGQYIIILSVAAGVNVTNWSEWGDGSLPAIIGVICGSWMGWVMLGATVLGNAGMYVAEMLEDSHQLEGLVNSDILPASTGFAWRHPKYNTPWGAIMPSLFFCLLGSCLNFHEILAIDNCLSVSSALLEILAFYKLRHSRPDPVEEPEAESQKVPGSENPLAVENGGTSAVSAVAALEEGTHNTANMSQNGNTNQGGQHVRPMRQRSLTEGSHLLLVPNREPLNPLPPHITSNAPAATRHVHVRENINQRSDVPVATGKGVSEVGGNDSEESVREPDEEPDYEGSHNMSDSRQRNSRKSQRAQPSMPSLTFQDERSERAQPLLQEAQHRMAPAAPGVPSPAQDPYHPSLSISPSDSQSSSSESQSRSESQSLSQSPLSSSGSSDNTDRGVAGAAPYVQRAATTEGLVEPAAVAAPAPASAQPLAGSASGQNLRSNIPVNTTTLAPNNPNNPSNRSLVSPSNISVHSSATAQSFNTVSQTGETESISDDIREARAQAGFGGGNNYVTKRPYVVHWWVVYFQLPVAFLFGCVVFCCGMAESWNCAVVNVIAIVIGFPLGWWLKNRFNERHPMSMAEIIASGLQMDHSDPRSSQSEENPSGGENSNTRAVPTIQTVTDLQPMATGGGDERGIHSTNAHNRSPSNLSSGVSSVRSNRSNLTIEVPVTPQGRNLNMKNSISREISREDLLAELRR